MKNNWGTLLLVCTTAFVPPCTVMAAQETNSAPFVQYLQLEVEEEKETLALEEAIEKALKNSTAVKNSNMELRLSEEQSQSAQIQFEGAQGGTTLNTLLQLIKQNASYSNALSAKAVQEEKIAYQMKEVYIELLQAEREIELAKMALQNMASNLKILQVKAQLGMIAAQQYQDSIVEYNKNAFALESKASELQTAYRNLNRLIGIDENKEYTLLLAPVLESPQLDIAIEAYALTQAGNTQVIKEKESALRIAQESRKVSSVDTQSTTSQTASDNAVNAADLSLNDTLSDLQDKIIDNYNSILDLEKQYKEAMAELENLKKQLLITQVKLQNGTVTALQVEEEKYALASKENTMLGLLYKHMLAVERFKNANLL